MNSNKRGGGSKKSQSGFCFQAVTVTQNKKKYYNRDKCQIANAAIKYVFGPSSPRRLTYLAVEPLQDIRQIKREACKTEDVLYDAAEHGRNLDRLSDVTSLVCILIDCTYE